MGPISASTTLPASSPRPFPLLAAVGAKTRRIEIGTAVIDMRYENPLYMVEDAGAADLIAGGRLQLGISRGSPEQVIDGWRHFGYGPPRGQSDADMGRRHAEVLLEALRGEGFAKPNPRPMFPTRRACCVSSPIPRVCATGSGGAPAQRHRDLGGEARDEFAKLDAQGRRDRRGVPHPAGGPDPDLPRRLEGGSPYARAAGLGQRSIFPLTDDRDRAYFGRGGQEEDQVGFIDEKTRAICGRGSIRRRARPPH